MQGFYFINFKRKHEIYTLKKEIQVLSNEVRLNSNLAGHDKGHKIRTIYYKNLILANLSLHGFHNEASLAITFHDDWREKDGWDLEHSIRGEEYYMQEIAHYFPGHDHESISYAIKLHNKQQGKNGSIPIVKNFNLPKKINPLVAMVVQDADRLDLLRFPLFFPIVNPKYLNFEFSRRYANSPQHRAIYGL